MSFIKNTAELLSHGNAALRRAAVDIVEAALESADPEKAARRLVQRDGDRLTVGSRTFDLSRQGRIFIMGAGKASFPIARALEAILGEKVADGVVVAKHGQQGSLARCRLRLAAHPIPDEAGFAAAREALALARETRPGDIVFGCITGGSSALLPYPVDGISLDDKKEVNRLLLTCGANIIEINAVRKHLSRVKGGHLAAAIHPGAHLFNLTVSDVIGDPLDYITDPTVPDTSTFDDARETLSKYDLWDRIPETVARFLRSAGPEQETPKEADLAGLDRHDHIIVAGDAACTAAAEKARAMGFDTMILSTMLEGESRELGRTFAGIANEIVLNRRPLVPPCAVIGGGETTVTIADATAGSGGPNQEFALGAAAFIAGSHAVVVAGIDSDGTDGPTDLAGALVDGDTAGQAAVLGIDLHASLNRHDTAAVLQQLGDAVVTGATGTNVNDLKLLLVGGAPDTNG